MRRLLWCVCAILSAGGCVTQKVYEIDFAEVERFDWDGKLRVTKKTEPRIGPFLTVERVTKVDTVELRSHDGRTVVVSAEGYNAMPIAEVAVKPPDAVQVLGTRVVWAGPMAALIVEGDLCAVAEAAADGTCDSSEQPSLRVRGVPGDRRPFADHVDELTLADWWAIAQSSADSVTVEYHVPSEKLRVVASGPMPGAGPATLEVFAEDGRLLKRYERRPMKVKRIEPPDAK
jgi:hypothetical protein